MFQGRRSPAGNWGSAQPDANNILQISKLFGVTADYLLNDDDSSDNDLPNVKKVRGDHSRQILIYLVTLEVMVLIMQFMCVFILQNVFFGVMSFIPFVAAIGGFEYAFQKGWEIHPKGSFISEKIFIKSPAWLGSYFPIRLLIMVCMSYYPRPYSALVLECVILTAYIAAALTIDLAVEKDYFIKKN